MSEAKSTKRGILLCLIVLVGFVITLGVIQYYQNICLVPENNYIRSVAGTDSRMLSADYWIARCKSAKELLLTSDEISTINKLNSKMISDGISDSFELLDIQETVTGEFVRNFVTLKGVPEDAGALYLNGKPTESEYWEKLVENSAADDIPPAVAVRFGYSTQRSTLRGYTSYDFIGESAEDTYYDEAVMSELLPFLPLAVLHESADGEWYYVLMYGMGGWVKKENVALCDSREDWLQRQVEENFLVVTGRELRLGTYPTAPKLSSQVLPMGTRLPLVPLEEVPESVCGRQSFDCYVVKLPVRGEDGMIEDEYIPVPVSDDVSVGLLPYTRENIIRQAFKCLGDRYGWSGDHYATDCSGLVHEVYACFGFVLPRAAGAQAEISGAVICDLSEMSEDEKLEEIKSLKMGSLVHFPGHIMIYLGTVDGKPYIISAVGSFATPDMPVGEVLSVNCVTINDLFVHRRSGKTWLDSVNALISIENVMK